MIGDWVKDYNLFASFHIKIKRYLHPDKKEMKNLTKKVLRKLLEAIDPSDDFHRQSYSQEGEDLILSQFIDVQSTQKGFYVDVGAHHPFRLSNSYIFYKNSWSGICIDPNPETKILFEKFRPRDIFIECGVSKELSTLPYYMFNEAALNTFDAETANLRNGLQNYKLLEVKYIITDSLSSILEKNAPKNKKFAFMTIDAEGYDLQVLESNDWIKFRPEYLVVECSESNILNLQNNEVVSFLKSVGFYPYSKTGNSVIFQPINKS